MVSGFNLLSERGLCVLPIWDVFEAETGCPIDYQTFGRVPPARERPITLRLETLSKYLGRQASVLLADPPFKDWAVERSFEPDLESPVIDYVFPHNGMDLVCDQDDRVSTVFLYADGSRCFTDGVEELPFGAGRRDVIARLGTPSRSGDKSSSPILGEHGPWDRFSRPGYAIHVEYRLDVDVIQLITLMRDDVVP